MRERFRAVPLAAEKFTKAFLFSDPRTQAKAFRLDDPRTQAKAFRLGDPRTQAKALRRLNLSKHTTYTDRDVPCTATGFRAQKFRAH